jgi:hypothetical protein
MLPDDHTVPNNDYNEQSSSDRRLPDPSRRALPFRHPHHPAEDIDFKNKENNIQMVNAASIAAEF